MAEGLTSGEIAELAGLFYGERVARQLLEAAGLTRADQPAWGPTARTFWTEVSMLLAAGVLADGCRRVITEAHRRFPANQVLGRADRFATRAEAPRPRADMWSSRAADQGVSTVSEI